MVGGGDASSPEKSELNFGSPAISFVSDVNNLFELQSLSLAEVYEDEDPYVRGIMAGLRDRPASIGALPNVPKTNNTKAYALMLLNELGLNKADITKFTAGMGPKGYSALANFRIACDYMGVPVSWGEQQIQAYLIYVNYKYYAAQYLTRQWKTIVDLGEFLCAPVSEKQIADFELVQAQAKEIKDNKVPVSMKLLKELCAAADIVFQPYNAALSKALFLAAWAGYMRISEYSRTSGKHGNKHNLRGFGLLTSPAGLSFNFHSDKTSRSSQNKHRFVSWRGLPKFARAAFADYNRLRPRQAYNYFCREDGIELTRSYVLNLLDSCLLLTSYKHLHVTPHCFRLGAASHDRLIGLNMRDIEDKGRWGPKSKAIEAYTRPDIVVLTPSTLWNDLPKYRRYWTPQRLAFLAKCLVEKPSEVNPHPFGAVLEKHFPDLKEYDDELPMKYPHQQALARLAEIKENRRSGIYLKKFSAAEARKLRDCFSRGKVAQLLRREAKRRIKGACLPFSYLRRTVKLGLTGNKATQVSTKKKETAVAEIQTDEVIVLSKEEFKELKDSGRVKELEASPVPRKPSLQQAIEIGFADQPIYDITEKGVKYALTKKQLMHKQKMKPKMKTPGRSLSARKRFDLRSKIRRRISRRYREHRNNSRLKPHQRSPEDDESVKITDSVRRLIEFFMAEILEKGEEGLPVWREEYDPKNSSKQYEDAVLEQYRNKPSNYEQLLKVKLHNGTYQRELKKARRPLDSSPESMEAPAIKPKRRKRRATKVVSYAESSTEWESQNSSPWNSQITSEQEVQEKHQLSFDTSPISIREDFEDKEDQSSVFETSPILSVVEENESPIVVSPAKKEQGKPKILMESSEDEVIFKLVTVLDPEVYSNW